ncbi:HNH endonuclease [Pseudomonas tohonis]|uniref:HNH endonuclease n=1 Tax=Pseudomonas tohonis TaxID=2725477 RepID=UPI001F45D257|nr:HNH endonuclease signature motif containing protein [Pseudomonas tohonis]
MKAKAGSSAAKGYGHRWQLARADFLRHNPLCKFCLAEEKHTPATVVDHVIAHRLGQAKLSGDPDQIARAWKLFWDRTNWQPLCKPCHDSVKQRMEKSGRVLGCTDDGRPLDPRHHWNRATEQG